MWQIIISLLIEPVVVNFFLFAIHISRPEIYNFYPSSPSLLVISVCMNTDSFYHLLSTHISSGIVILFNRKVGKLDNISSLIDVGAIVFLQNNLKNIFFFFLEKINEIYFFTIEWEENYQFKFSSQELLPELWDHICIFSLSFYASTLHE